MHWDSTTGDPSSLEALILSCVEPVNRMAYRYCGAVGNHEDFFSIGMLRICEVAAYAQANATEPCAYLCGAARNAMIDEYNRLRRLAVVSLDAPLVDDGDLCLADLVPDRSSYSAPVAPGSVERARALQNALGRLTARQRAAVRRRAGLPGYGAHNLEETARALRTSSTNAAHLADRHGRHNLARDARLCEALGLGVV